MSKNTVIIQPLVQHNNVQSETVITCDPDTPGIDIPSFMHGQGYEKGVKTERARIVAWLQEKAQQIREEEEKFGMKISGCSRVAIVADELEKENE